MAQNISAQMSIKLNILNVQDLQYEKAKEYKVKKLIVLAQVFEYKKKPAWRVLKLCISSPIVLDF